MIVDKIENLGLYYPVLKGLQEASEFVKKFYKEPSENGRYDIDGDHIFASASTYVTKSREGAQFEAHRKYADLQAVIDGTEIISWAPVDTLKEESESFSTGGDIAFYSGETVIDTRLPAGYFAILFPEDAHMPCILDKEASEVTKIVVKIEL